MTKQNVGNGNTLVLIFSNFDFEIQNATGVGTIGFGTQGVPLGDPLPTDVLFTGFGTSQYSTTSTVSPTVFSIAGGAANYTVYGVGNGQNQRGMITTFLTQ